MLNILRTNKGRPFQGAFEEEMPMNVRDLLIVAIVIAVFAWITNPFSYIARYERMIQSPIVAGPSQLPPDPHQRAGH